ncbi:hypothetical protein GW17_00029009 [Ensete ventricosum]|nr:hypothetical protein GW17_00029009 [Ensete ventricosum]
MVPGSGRTTPGRDSRKTHSPRRSSSWRSSCNFVEKKGSRQRDARPDMLPQDWFTGGIIVQEKNSTVCLLQHGVVSAASLPHSIVVDTSTGAASTASAAFPVSSASSRPSRCASRLGFHAFRRAKNGTLLLVNML